VSFTPPAINRPLPFDPPEKVQSSNLTSVSSNAILNCGFDYNVGKLMNNRYNSMVSYTTSEIPIFSMDAVSNAAKLNTYDSLDADVLQSSATATTNDDVNPDQNVMDIEDLDNSVQSKQLEIDVLEEHLDISTGMEIPLDTLLIPDDTVQKDMDDSDVLEDYDVIDNMTPIISTPKDAILTQGISLPAKDAIRNLDFRSGIISKGRPKKKSFGGTPTFKSSKPRPKLRKRASWERRV